ncbi:hypothetical protein DFJ73DRAFT_266614 [Zopfochytrium polystomum]|nr:hypothetical protein DFJ73DRAFT_266614 [Zopfochytrium polystomum]
MEETYLENHYIQQYFSDVVSMIAERRPDQPLRFMKEYFESIKSGEIVLRRDYDYIRATPANRLAFVSKYGEALNEIAESLSVKDLHCVVELLCFDFPLSTVLHCGQLAAYISWKASSHSKSMDPPPRDPEDLFVPVSTFVRTLRFYLVFEEFFQCSERAIKDAVAALRRSAKKDPKTPLSQLVLTDVHYKQVSASVKATVLASLSNS